MSDQQAKLQIDDQVYQLPIVVGTENERAIDIRELRATTGFVTLDTGYMNTGSCQSSITFLDGERGVLRYRGYPIEQLAEESHFLEVAFLLDHGRLPNQDELNNFRLKIASHSNLPDGAINILQQFPKDAHPMGVILAVTSALSSFYPRLLKMPLEPSELEEAIAQLMGKLKIIAANFYRHSQGKDFCESDPSLSYAADFLKMMFSDESEEYELDVEVVKALDTLFILHADHEQNCSTSTVRMVGSSQANAYATIAGAISALWGQLHGGANQSVLEMLETIQQDGGDYKKFLEKAKDKEDSFRLMGFGHRVYKIFDPRATIIKKACHTVLEKLEIVDPLLDIAKGLEETALNDSYFIERNLYPNVDFYSGIMYKALKIPTEMFTVMFVLGRLPGWLAQWKEMSCGSDTKICRPRQIYTGEKQRDYLAIEKR